MCVVCVFVFCVCVCVCVCMRVCVCAQVTEEILVNGSFMYMSDVDEEKSKV